MMCQKLDLLASEIMDQKKILAEVRTEGVQLKQGLLHLETEVSELKEQINKSGDVHGGKSKKRIPLDLSVSNCMMYKNLMCVQFCSHYIR